MHSVDVTRRAAAARRARAGQRQRTQRRQVWEQRAEARRLQRQRWLLVGLAGLCAWLTLLWWDTRAPVSDASPVLHARGGTA